MSKKSDVLDHLGCFHDYNLFIPSRIIKLESRINEHGDEVGVGYSMSSEFIRNLTILDHLSSDPITVLLSTLGGDVWEGFAIYDAIKGSKCHITIKVIGTAMSMGSIILQAADERVLSPHAIVMFHSGESGSPRTNPYEVKNFVDFDFKYCQQADRIVLDKINEKRTKDNQALLSKHAFKRMCLEGTYLLAQEAIDLGLADRIE